MEDIMKYRSVALVGCALLAAGCGRLSVQGTQPEAAAQYTASGDLIFPKDYREWVFLTSGVNMTYSDAPSGMDHDMVDNVFVDPQSWQAFKKTGNWPDGTVMIKEPRLGANEGSISKGGTFQTEEVFNLEVHVKDSKRFKGGWAFFVHSAEQPAEVIPSDAACYSCHTANGAVDTTFVQFYPTAKPVAVKAGTFDASR
jgi:Cytochrome P460